MLDEHEAAELRPAPLRRGADRLRPARRTGCRPDRRPRAGTAARARSLAIYDELRARGQLEPAAAAGARAATVASRRCRRISRLVEDLAVVVAARARRGEPTPASGCPRRSTQLGRRPQRAGVTGCPGRASSQRIALGTGARRLKSQACDDYRAALEELAEMAAEQFAVGARDALDALLRAYGERYTALKRAPLRSGLRRPRAARA